ncbi:zinc finger MYND domain-containing protein [Microdochium nivale]|nr:zinc finger MYND domain-containing protein [Microdochium nivale]
MNEVEAFFSRLPSPGEHENFLQQHGAEKHEQLVAAMRLLNRKAAAGTDHHFLASRLPQQFHSGGFGVIFFWHVIASLALSQDQHALTGNTSKARQLRFYKWIARGRNGADTSVRDTGVDSSTQAQREEAASLPEETNTKCAQCQAAPPAAGAFSYCRGCVMSSGARRISCTYYCGPTCQTEHWKTHKNFCSTRKKIVRAANLLQKMLYALEAAGSLRQIRSLTVNQGITRLEEVPQDELVFRGEPLLHVLERANAPSQAAYHSALTANTCTEVIVAGRPLLERLLGPFCKRMELVAVIPKNAVNPLLSVNDNSATTNDSYMMFGAHNVLRLTTKSDDTLLLDVAGAQYGWQEAIAPWDKWCRHRALHVGASYPVSDQLENMQRMSASQELVQGEDLRRSLASRITEIIQKEVSQRSLQSAAGLFGLAQAAYDGFEQSIVLGAQRACLAITQAIRPSGRQLWYFDETGTRRLTTSLAETSALRHVWLTEAEIKNVQGNPAALRAAWARRCRLPANQARFLALGMNMRF